MDTKATPDELFAVVSDIANYPEWLELVAKAEPAEAETGDVGAAWFITLRAAVGPLARSKRLRMVVVESRSPEHLTLERSEIDGRDHSTWRLTSGVTAVEESAGLTLGLHYDGKFWNSVLDAVLARQIEATRPRLRDYLAGLSATT